MQRLIMAELEQWRLSENRKPLLIQGARQVGKTWLMKAFGKAAFEQVAYINFESSSRLQTVFQSDFDIQRILATFEIETGISINAATTLLIFDEIQEAEKGLTALKYFQENAPHYFVVAAGSLLGVSLQKNHTFPVGKVDMLQLHPLSFEEFLLNLNEVQLLRSLKACKWDVLAPFHEKLMAYLRLYYFTGGMPEAVQTYLQTKNLQAVRTVQQNIITGYENDFAKYAPVAIVPKIRMVWQAVLGQLSKENKKFIYGQLKKSARAKEFEDAINWLVHAGLLVKCMKVEKPVIPLASYADMDAFKLFMCDVGLLNAMADLNEQLLLNKNQILVEFKGALTEQFVCQQLILKAELYYWSAANATAEIDFVIQQGLHVVPVEVKAEENLKSKSLKVYSGKFHPPLAVRTSMSFYRKETWMVNIPLYAIFLINESPEADALRALS